MTEDVRARMNKGIRISDGLQLVLRGAREPLFCPLYSP